MPEENTDQTTMTTTKIIKAPKVSFIVAALLPDLGIGNQGQLPWALKQEMKYFRKITTNTIEQGKRNAVVMGRKTYMSIPEKFRPLKDRFNIVLTRNIPALKEEMKEELAQHKDNLFLSDSLPKTIEALKETDKVEEIYIIGGAEVYNQLMKKHEDMIDAIYLTEITHNDKIDTDTYFLFDKNLWIKCDTEKLKKVLESKGLHEEFEVEGNIENNFHFDFTLWEKNL